jgi:xylose isomerase
MNPQSEKVYFPKLNKIKYSPDSKNDDVLCFRHYNENENIMGKPMSEWLRFAVCFWHTFVWQGNDIFGSPTFDRPWNNKDLTPMEQAKHRIHAAFEFFEKLGVKYYTFHDRDFAPEGDTLEESNKNIDEIVSIAEELQKKTGVKLLWGTANLFSNKRYMNGAGTNPDVHAFAYAGSQVKKMLEVTHRLKGENFVFWGGREGYQCLLNTNVKKELDHMAVFLKMANSPRIFKNI